MYLIIKDNEKKQMPIRAYRGLKDAKEYLDNYIKDSYFNWTYTLQGEKHTKVYIRYLENGRIETAFIHYMRLY